MIIRPDTYHDSFFKQLKINCNQKYTYYLNLLNIIMLMDSIIK